MQNRHTRFLGFTSKEKNRLRELLVEKKVKYLNLYMNAAQPSTQLTVFFFPSITHLETKNYLRVAIIMQAVN